MIRFAWHMMTESIQLFYQKTAQKRPFAILILEKNNRPGGWKQGAFLPRNSGFRPKNDDITHQYALLFTLRTMLLYTKSIAIAPQKTCYWLEGAWKQATNGQCIFTKVWLSITYKSRFIFGLFATRGGVGCKYAKHGEVLCQDNSQHLFVMISFRQQVTSGQLKRLCMWNR